MEKDISNTHIEEDSNDTMSEIIEIEKTEEVEEPKLQVDLQVDQLDGVGAVTKKKLEALKKRDPFIYK